MITKEVAAQIFHAYREIENAGKMIEELKERLNEKGEFELRDRWGDVAGLELHIPNPSGSFSIKRVPFELALTVIQKHIDTQHAELARLKEVCRIQLA